MKSCIKPVLLIQDDKTTLTNETSVCVLNRCSDRFIDSLVGEKYLINYKYDASAYNFILKKFEGDLLINSILYNPITNEDLIIGKDGMYISRNCIDQIGYMDDWFPYACFVEDYYLRALIKGLNIKLEIDFDQYIHSKYLNISYKNFSKQMIYLKYSIPLKTAWKDVPKFIQDNFNWEKELYLGVDSIV